MASTSKGSVVHHVLLEYLADEEWHDAEKVIRIGSAAVPPGVAIRLAEADRVAIWKKDHPGQPVPPRIKNLDKDYQIRVGARRYAVQVLRNKAFEWNDEKTKVRLSESRKYQYNGRGTYMLKEYREPEPEKTEAQLAEERKERSRQAWRTRQIQKGLDPDAPRGYELRAQRKAEWEALSPEEKKAIKAERARKAYATRKARKEANAPVQDDP